MSISSMVPVIVVGSLILWLFRSKKGAVALPREQPPRPNDVDTAQELIPSASPFNPSISMKVREVYERALAESRQREYGKKEMRIVGTILAEDGCALIESSDGTLWLIDGARLSPFPAFGDCRVVLFGEAYQPDPLSAYMIGWRDGRALAGHFRVSSLRLAEEMPNAQLTEVGAQQEMTGRFEHRPNDTGDSALFFITENSDAFRVVNNPNGMEIGQRTDVWAYPVQPKLKLPGPCLWIACPWSCSRHGSTKIPILNQS